MIRTILGLLLTSAAVGVVVATGGCSQTGVGDPCIPEQEYQETFNGFDEKEVNVESKSFQCQTRLCLVNHFRGRVSCPYGQDKDGNPTTTGGKACSIPGTDKAVSGNPTDTKIGKTVQPQCLDRSGEKTVYCSCRCANIDGRNDDGANYCTCPEGFACQQLVTSIGAGDTGLTGAYCIKTGTTFDKNNNCASSCDPVAKNCETK